MTKYKNIDDLDARIERIIKKTVESYYTDWKNYDRPKYMGLKSSRDRKDKDLILIARKCGTYLLTVDSIKNSEWAGTVYEYYQTQETADYYHINLDRLAIEKINPAAFIKAA